MLLDEVISKAYEPREYPALSLLADQWVRNRPFYGKKVLVATPIFRNTLVEYRALIAGGAFISVGYSTGNGAPAMPRDERIVEMLKEWEIPVVTDEDIRSGAVADDFDLILDCAGQFSFCHPRKGFVELTRSGIQFFTHSDMPVYVADSGIVKRIETTLGTGDGYFRALAQYGHGVMGENFFEGKKLVVFGSGKVGCGIALQGIRRGMDVITVTDIQKRGENGDFCSVLENNGVKIEDFRDEEAVAGSVAVADYLVTATGVKNALSWNAIMAIMNNPTLVVANMGVEDELGEMLMPSRVLNAKAPLNFVLEEPTHLKYIDASLALHAALGERLLKEYKGGEKPFVGPQDPPSDIEQMLLMTTIQNGTIGAEIFDMLR